MSDPQRTHKATPKRVREFRKRGEIALSRDVVSTATLTGGAIGVVAGAGASGTALMELTRTATFASDGRPADGLPRAVLDAFLVSAGPAMAGATIAAIIAIGAQLGWPPAFKGISFDLGRISPFTNLKQTFALSAVTRRTGAAIAKLLVVGGIVVVALQHGIATHAMHATGLASVGWGLVRRTLWFVLVALAALAAIDYVLARRRIAAQMRMSPDELKREGREQEGDPTVKGRRKARMRELAKRRISATVAKADVVVVNPTHYAVALRYDDTRDRAPIVVAKGMDEVAEKIREVARANNVPVLSRPPLARALHKHVKEGRTVPPTLYKAVAEVLAYVYRLRRGASA